MKEENKRMKAKILKDLIYKNSVLKAGESAEIDDVSFYTLENRGLIEKISVFENEEGKPVEGLPPLDDVQTASQKGKKK